MNKATNSLSRKQIIIFAILGVAIFIGFPVALIRMGVDYFLMVAPIFLLFYATVVSIYVGSLAASFAKSNGISSWLWAAIAILLTVGLMTAVNVIDPQYTLYGCLFVPLFSIPLTLFLIHLARLRANGHNQ